MELTDEAQIQIDLMIDRATQIRRHREQLQLPAFDFANDPLGPIANLGTQLADDVLQLQQLLAPIQGGR